MSGVFPIILPIIHLPYKQRVFLFIASTQLTQQRRRAGGEFTKEYVDATVPEMAFGEFWDTCEYTDGVLNYNQDAHRQRTVNWCDRTGGTASAFDFTTKGASPTAVLRMLAAHTSRARCIGLSGEGPGLLAGREQRPPPLGLLLRRAHTETPRACAPHVC